MTIAALPDTIGAIMLRLRSFPEILAFVSTAGGYADDATTAQKARPRVSVEAQSYWKLPYPAILISGPIGSPGDDRSGAMQRTRFDLHCYGTNPYEAMRLWRQVHPCLCPTLHQGVSEAFVIGGVRVCEMDKEGGPIRLIEPDTKYPKVVATYVVTSSEVGL